MTAAHDYECIRCSRLVTASDLLEEVSDACDELLAAAHSLRTLCSPVRVDGLQGHEGKR